jgi:hypothetical protein
MACSDKDHTHGGKKKVSKRKTTYKKGPKRKTATKKVAKRKTAKKRSTKKSFFARLFRL